MAEQKLPKLTTGVRFPSPAPAFPAGGCGCSSDSDAIAPPPSAARGPAAKRLTAALILLLAVLCPGAAAAPAAERYSIWWSPALQLDSLDRLEARLGEPAPIQGMELSKGDRMAVRAAERAFLDRIEGRLGEPAPILGMDMDKDYPVVARVVVTDCNSLLRLRAEGFEAQMGMNHSSRCTTPPGAARSPRSERRGRRG